MVNTSPTSNITPATPTPPRIEPPRKPRTWRNHVYSGFKWLALVMFCAYLYASFVHTEFNFYTLYMGAQDIQRVMSDLVHPDLSWYAYDLDGNLKLDSGGDPKPGTLPVLLDSMNETVQISLIGTLIAVLFSFPMAFLAAKNLMRGSPMGMAVYTTTRFVLNVLRAFPPYVLAIIFVFMVGPGPFPGVLALGLHSIGMLGKLFSEAIEGVDEAPIEAVKATGATNYLIVWFGILPQVTPQFVAYSLYRWDINIRMSIILGIVGAGGIGFLLDQYIRLFQYNKTSTAFLIILVAVTVLDWASGYFREKLG